MNYIRIPGEKTHELPPLLIRSAAETGVEQTVDLAGVLAEVEEMLPAVDADDAVIEQRRYDLATTLAEHYRGLLARWMWGDSILEWIRQCEITFETEAALRNLLHSDLWPHASRSSFVTLLTEKQVPVPGSGPQQAVGLRLTFRQLPPIHCCSDQFLFYLSSPLADSAYQTWARLSAKHAALLPPDRFHFDVLAMDPA